MGRVRRAGARWRLLVHEYLGERGPGKPRYGREHHVTNNRDFGGSTPDGEHSLTHGLPANTEFDELVVGRWLHVEAMQNGLWWMNIGGVTVWVGADRDGRARTVSVYMPGRYAEPVPGARYRLDDKEYLS